MRRKNAINQAFKFTCARDMQMLYCARLNVIGPEGAGKTSVVRSLLGQPFQSKHVSTVGIDCSETKCKLNVAYTAGWKLKGMDRQKMVDSAFIDKVVENYLKDPCEVEPLNINDMVQNCTEFITAEASTSNEHPTLREYTIDMDLISNAEDDFIQETMNKVKQKGKKGRKTRESFKLRLWDHGGQLEYYATHHLFLVPDSVNLLVLDISQGLESKMQTKKMGRFGEKEISLPGNVIEFVHYWMNTIYTHTNSCKDSRSTKEMPVIIVLTHKDKLDPDNRETYIKQYISAFLKHLDGRAYEKMVCPSMIFYLDNRNGDKLELRILKKAIVECRVG